MSGRLIVARAGKGFDRLAAMLAARAAGLARAHVAARTLTNAGDARRWRKAALLWPNFEGQSPWK